MTSGIDPSKLVHRLKWGGVLTGDEIEALQQHLEDPAGPDRLYNVFRALALGAPATGRNVSLVERYLGPETDDYDLKGVIYALCKYWGLTERYIDQLLFYSRLDKWERYSEASIAALSALGDYLHRTQDPGLYSKLLERFDHGLSLWEESSPMFDGIYFESIYNALNQGIKGRAARLDAIGFEFPDDIEDSVVKEARLRAGKQMN